MWCIRIGVGYFIRNKRQKYNNIPILNLKGIKIIKLEFYCILFTRRISIFYTPCNDPKDAV